MYFYLQNGLGESGGNEFETKPQSVHQPEPPVDSNGGKSQENINPQEGDGASSSEGGEEGANHENSKMIYTQSLCPQKKQNLKKNK